MDAMQSRLVVRKIELKCFVDMGFVASPIPSVVIVRDCSAVMS